MDEIAYITPPNEDEPEYTKCEHCNGIGYFYHYYDDLNMCKEDCEYCENGLIEIEN